MGARALVAFRDKDAPQLTQALRRHRRQAWTPVIAGVLGGAAVIAVLYMARERIVSNAGERVRETQTQIAATELGIENAQRERDMDETNRLTRELGAQRERLRAREERLAYAQSIGAINGPILFLNLALLITAAIAAYSSHRASLTGKGGGDPREEALDGRMRELRDELRGARDRAWAAARDAQAALTEVRYLVRARPLQHWQGKAERLRRVIPLFRAENARLLNAAICRFPCLKNTMLSIASTSYSGVHHAPSTARGGSQLDLITRARSRNRCGGRRARIDEFAGCELHAKVQALEGTRSEQDKVTRLAEHDLIDRSLSNHVNERRPHPTFDDCTVRLSKPPFGKALDTERLENVPRKPRQLGASVDEHILHAPALAGAGGILDLEVDAEGSHLEHDDSCVSTV